MWNALNNNSMDALNKAVYRKDETIMLERMLSHSKVCIINGVAGIGKTYFVKMYASSRENVVYIRDSQFHDFDLENRVIDYSFAKSITSNSLLIIDEIDEDINHYLNSSFFVALQKMSFQNIILITRQDVPKGKIPVLTLQPLTLEQTYELMKKTIGDKYPYTEQEQIARLSNGNPLILKVICSLMDTYSNIDEIWEQLLLPENKRLIYPFTQKFNDTFLLDDSEIQTYVEILMFGKIEKSLLMRWDSRLNEKIEKDITTLMSKGIISSDNGLLYGDYLARDILDEYPLCYDYCTVISQNMKRDILNGMSVEDKYAIALISMLKNHYKFVDFIVVFYEQKIESQKKEGFNDLLIQILQELGYLEESIEKNVIPQVNRIDENFEKLVETQNKIQIIINQLIVGLKDNEKALEVLEELSEIVKNPKKSKWDRVNSCVGFLGSVATLATFSVNGFATNANALITQLNALINMLPFMRSLIEGY